MSWIDDLTTDLEVSVRGIEEQLVARTPKMLRGAIKPLSEFEVREVASSFSLAVANAIAKSRVEDREAA